MQLAHPSRLTHWIRQVNPQIAGLLQQRLQSAETSAELGGSHPFVNDWITEPSAFRAVMAEKRDVLFPDHIVSSLRRNPDGSVRRVNKWVGRNRLRATTATSSDSEN
jgi:hypothetical protein